MFVCVLFSAGSWRNAGHARASHAESRAVAADDAESNGAPEHAGYDAEPGAHAADATEQPNVCWKPRNGKE